MTREGDLKRRIADEAGAPGRRVLVALEDPGAAGRLAREFSNARIAPSLAFSCAEVIDQVRNETYALVLLGACFAHDKDSGCLEEVRAASGAPVLALGDVDEDDYGVVDLALDPQQPPSQIVERGTALVEMARPVPLPYPIRWGSLKLDTRTHLARWNSSPLHLTESQFKIMEILILAAGAVVTTEQLCRRVWGESSVGEFGALKSHVRRIRQLIEDDPSTPKFLVRVRGRGFRLADASAEALDT
ncbi:MAG: winged helix-turn-helix domain-containing protein [Actinomycetota bacterium]|nr:winged helix-turn-helix domain-containing protein [Actinomycetota bacterium]